MTPRQRIRRIRADLDALETALAPHRPTVWERRSLALRKCAEQVWTYLFAEPLPAHVEMRWCPHLGPNAGQATVGAIHSHGVVQLDWSYLHSVDFPLAILVHEFAHVRGFERHDRRFWLQVNGWLQKLSLPKETVDSTS